MGKNYLVTGGTDGIGLAIVEKILKESLSSDDKVIVTYGHNDERAREMYDNLSEDDKAKVTLIKYDMSDSEHLDLFVEEVYKTVDMLDYFVSNVGIGEYAPFEEYTLEMWNKVLTTNLTVPTFLVQKFMNRMNENGSILLVGSYVGVLPFSRSAIYCVSKSALLYLAKVLVKELESKKIRINSIAPGFTETRWHEGKPQASIDRITQKIALHRFGKPNEIADMSYSILVNEYMNGSAVDIHGGYNYF